MQLQVGDVVKLKPRFIVNGSSGICIVIKIESVQGPGWVAYDYVAMQATGLMIRITESCVATVYSTN